MRMFLPAAIACLASWLGMLAYNINMFFAFLVSLAITTAIASIITKIDFGSWNPF